MSRSLQRAVHALKRRVKMRFVGLLIILLYMGCSSPLPTQTQSEIRLEYANIKIAGGRLHFDEEQQHIHLYPTSLDLRVDIQVSGCQWQNWNWTIHYPTERLKATWQSYRSAPSDFDLFINDDFFQDTQVSSQVWQPTSEATPFNLIEGQWGFKSNAALDQILFTSPLNLSVDQSSENQPSSPSPSCAQISSQRQGQIRLPSEQLIQLRFSVTPRSNEWIRIGILSGPISSDELENWIQIQNEESESSSTPLDVIVLNGDLSQGDKIQKSDLRERLEKLRVPWLLNVGNQDLKKTTLASWEKEFGDYPFLSEWSGIRFLILNTAEEYLNTNHSALSKIDRFFNQRHLFWSDLPPSKLFLIFTHIPPIATQSTESDFLRRVDAVRFLSFLDQYPYTHLVSTSQKQLTSTRSTLLHQIHLPNATVPPLDLNQSIIEGWEVPPSFTFENESRVRWTELVVDRLCIDSRTPSISSSSCLQWIIH